MANLKKILPACDVPGSDSGEVIVGTIEWKGYFSITSELYRGRTPTQVQAAYHGRRIHTLYKYWYGGGQCTEAFQAAYPEFAHLLKYHLVQADGPMHYIANTVYRAGDRDHHGLRKGEFRAYTPTRWGISYAQIAQAKRDVCAHQCPPPAVLEYTQLGLVGEGKAREFDAARSAACWPEATDAELSVERDELVAALEARLPALMERFRSDVEAALGWQIDTAG